MEKKRKEQQKERAGENFGNKSRAKNAIKLKKLDEVCDKRVRNPWGVKDWHSLII